MNSKQVAILSMVVSFLAFQLLFLLSHVEEITLPRAIMTLAFVLLFITMASILYRILR